MRNIDFCVGDVVECDYYKVRGYIKRFFTQNNTEYIEIEKSDGSVIQTKIKTKSSNRPWPYYLRLIAKKSDLAIAQHELLEIN